MDELIGKDLSMLIPEPIKSYHPSIVQLSDTDEGGRRFTDRATLSLLCNTKSGHLINFELGLRFNTNISNSFQYVGIFNFPIGNSESTNAVITCKDGYIKGATYSASLLFEIGSNLKDYNSDFERLYRVNFKHNSSFL